MSSFVVRDRTINQVITWLQQQSPDSVYRKKILEADSLDALGVEAWADIGRGMFELNRQVVRQCYKDADDSGMIPENFTPGSEPATAIQVYKSLRCWLYQCGDARHSSVLYSIMREIADCIANDIICALPEYKDAFWDVRSNGKLIR